MIRNLHGEVLALVAEKQGSGHDTRFKAWIKKVTAVSPAGVGGYAFIGDFISTGTIDIQGPTVLLAATVRGSMKYHTTTYNVLVLDAANQLTVTDVRTNDKEKGWALRIRDQVAALLPSRAPASTSEPNPLAQFTDDQIIAEVRRRNLTP